jgi:hypothetical protein
MTLKYLFFITGAQSSFFTVNVPTQVQERLPSLDYGAAYSGNYEQDDRAQIYSS